MEDFFSSPWAAVMFVAVVIGVVLAIRSQRGKKSGVKDSLYKDET